MKLLTKKMFYIIFLLAPSLMFSANVLSFENSTISILDESTFDNVLNYESPTGMEEIKNVSGENEQQLWSMMELQVQASVPSAVLLKAYGKHGLLNSLKDLKFDFPID